MPTKKVGKQRKQLRKTEGEWEWHKRYRIWDANRKIFLYPENWIEPDLRLPTRFRESLGDVAAFICAKCGAKTKHKPIRKPAHRKSVRVLFTGKNRTGALLAAQTLARDLGKNLYRVDLGVVVSKYIGETEKNLRRVFDAAKKSDAVLFFDEADALFGKHIDVHDRHDCYANIEFNYSCRESRNTPASRFLPPANAPGSTRRSCDGLISLSASRHEENRGDQLLRRLATSQPTRPPLQLQTFAADTTSAPSMMI